MTDIDVVVDVGARLGECPLWSPQERCLYWVDIDGRVVHRYDPVAHVDEARTLAGRPGSLALTDTPGRLLVATEHELVWLDWGAGQTRPWIDLETPGTGNRLNDGRTDASGRFVVGSMYEDTSADRTTGALYQVDPDGTTVTLRTGVGVTNGLAFDPERSRMYFADTPTRTVLMWDYDHHSGERRNERVFLHYDDLPGKPDGACVDADGCYWSASVRGWAVIRVTPDGVVDRRIELPVERPTMPAFGGADLSTMFVTSIRSAWSPGTAPPGALPGGEVLAIDVGVHGRPEPVFAGSPGTGQSSS